MAIRQELRRLTHHRGVKGSIIDKAPLFRAIAKKKHKSYAVLAGEWIRRYVDDETERDALSWALNIGVAEGRMLRDRRGELGYRIGVQPRELKAAESRAARAIAVGVAEEHGDLLRELLQAG